MACFGNTIVCIFVVLLYLCIGMVTISDIAAALGVTPSTVSRALSGSPRVKEETRLAVEQMAAALGYERNVVASNLRKGKSDIVGIIVPRIHREFFANCIGGAATSSSARRTNSSTPRSRPSAPSGTTGWRAS